MSHSTLDVSDYQYLRAFRQLFPTPLLKRAVASRRTPTRNRLLPLWVLLALLITWFWQPCAKLPFLARWFLSSRKRTPSDPAAYKARARLGWRPLRYLRKRVAKPLASPELDPYAFYHGRRLLAIDGTTLTLPDTPDNDKTFGRPRNQHRDGGYPLARVVALCEVGTHALIDQVTRGYRRSEVDLARRLLARVPAGSLLLADRNFHSFGLWECAARRGFDLLIRVQKGPKLPVESVLPDGSYLSRVFPRRGKGKAERAVVVRVIRYTWTDAKGQTHESRLVTSLLDAAEHPACVLVELYHKRWEAELVFGEVKGRLSGRVTQVRAKDPVRVMQEIDGLLLGHFVLRWVMLQAAREAGVPAVEISFEGAVRILVARLDRVPKGENGRKKWWRELLKELGRERVRSRRPRQCPRVRKVTRSHWPVKKKGQAEGTIPTLKVVPQPPP